MALEPVFLSSRFRLGALIGRGGMGAVYEARDEHLERTVAVKCIETAELSDDERAHLTREARTVAAVSSPHIVQIFDLVSHEGDLWIVMERLRGRTLSAMLDAGTVEDAVLFELLAQALVGLEDAHAAGIVHRDVKPENLFVVDRHPRLLKVLDFGVAKWLDRATTRGSGWFRATPAYMAPEPFVGLPATPRSDVFSVGVILYRHFTGQFPFGDGVGPEYVAQVCAGAVRPVATLRPGLPKALADLIDQAVHPEPRRRIESARVLRERMLAMRSSDSNT